MDSTLMHSNSISDDSLSDYIEDNSRTAPSSGVYSSHLHLSRTMDSGPSKPPLTTKLPLAVPNNIHICVLQVYTEHHFQENQEKTDQKLSKIQKQKTCQRAISNLSSDYDSY
jgi:hypothetical protein